MPIRLQRGRKSAPKRLAVRDMRVDDVPKVFHLGEAIYNASDAPLLYRTWDPYEVALLYASETELSLVAAIGGEVVGFCLSTTIEKPNKPWRYGYVIWLAVDSGYRLRRVGRRLISETTRRMMRRGVRSILVDTPDDNRGAVAFFGKLGYQQRASQVWLWKDIEKPKSTRAMVDQGVASVRSGRSRLVRGG